MSVRVIKDADGVAQNKVASLGVTGLSLPGDRCGRLLVGGCCVGEWFTYKRKITQGQLTF